MPSLSAQMSTALITRLNIAEGGALPNGSPLLEVRLDLGPMGAQDCPPVYFFRLVSREKGWVRKVFASVGEARGAGDTLALISTERDEPIDGPPARGLRTSSASIVPEFEWPTASQER
jgi:hypothetical protein